MSSLAEYLLPIATGVILLLFFLGLPPLASVEIEHPSPQGMRSPRRRLDRKDAVIMLCITVLFGFTDFWHLGNTKSVESFASMNGQTAVFTVPEEETVSSIRLFTGVGYGEYTFYYLADDGSAAQFASFTQNAGDVLRWVSVEWEIPFSAREIMISGSGSAYLGEAAFFNTQEQQISISCTVKELCDEQDLVCTKQDFMNSTYFDEIYHARTAWEHLNNVYPYEISHPPLGKLILSAGIALFGMTPFGWRFSGTLFGVLMLPVMYVFVRKMFGSRNTAVCATLVFATDFMHYVQTRIATIDTYAVFFILLMYLFMYLFLTTDSRKMLAVSGVFFGLGAASKWTCLYAGAGLGVLWVLYWIIHRREGLTAFLKNVLFCIVFFILIPCVIYYLSYIPYGLAGGAPNIFSREYLDIVLSNQEYMFTYHSRLVAEHPYSSKWYQWILDIRPILYYLEYFPDGTRSSFGAFLNPVLCWGGLLAMFAVIYCAVFRRDINAGFIVIGYLAQLVPWMFVTRLTFEYHYFPCSVFLVLALAYVFRLMETGTRYSKLYLYGFAGLSAVIFVLFYPALSGMRVDSTLAGRLMGWLPTWPF